jgi:hypothetical protein
VCPIAAVVLAVVEVTVPLLAVVVALRVRRAAATTPLQDRFCGFGVTMRCAADGLAAVGELHADLEGVLLCEHASSHLGREFLVEAWSTRPDTAGHGELESLGVSRYPCDRHRGQFGPVKVQGIDQHSARKFRLGRMPWVMRLARYRFGSS